MVKYYPPVASMAKIVQDSKAGKLRMINFAEAQRLQDVEDKKRRGKGAPTKAKDKGSWDVVTASSSVDIICRAESQNSQETVASVTTSAPYIYLFASITHFRQIISQVTTSLDSVLSGVPLPVLINVF